MRKSIRKEAPNMKKVIAWLLVLALTAAVSIGATLAYLTDTDEDVNVMTLGKVKIEQLEYERINGESKNDGAGGRWQKAADDSQRGGFAAAGGAQQGEKFMVIKVEIDTVEYPFPVELHNKVLESDELFRHYPPPFLL